MLRKKHRSMLLILVAAIFMLSTGNNAVADGPLSNTCTFVDANGTPNPNGNSLQILPDANGNWPQTLVSSGTTMYAWVYEIKGSLNGINQVVALETVCSPLPELGYALPNGGQIGQPGAGDPTTGYGLGDWQDYTVRMAAQAIASPINNYGFFTAKAGPTRNTSMQMKMGKYVYYCHNIAGPACYSPKIAATTQQKIQLNPDNPDQYIIVTFKSDGSVVSVVDNTGAPLAWHDLSELGAVNGLPVTYMPDGSIMKTGEHSCYSYFYLGRYCTKCY